MSCFSHCVFIEDVEEFQTEDTLLEFIEYVGNLVDVGLQVEKCNPLLIHCVLNFYDLVSTIFNSINTCLSFDRRRYSMVIG